jgi:predicted nucleotide-binding protein
MRIGITGSWKQKDRKSWGLGSDIKSFADACRLLGAALAKTGASITVGSDSEFTADRYAVEGYLSESHADLAVRVVRPEKGSVPFAELYSKHPKAFVYLTGSSPNWRHTRQMFVHDVDALVTVAGADGTYQAGLEIGLTKKKLVPVGSFGGASQRLLTELRKSALPDMTRRYERLSNPWVPDLASHVMSLLGAGRPSRVLLIHGHSDDRIALKQWLERENLADAIVMAQEFTAGQTLPEKFEELASAADAAIALATPDDLAVVGSTSEVARKRARQNVWVEVGWFWGRLGRNRVLLLVRGELEIPSDLDGIEYYQYETSVLDLAPHMRKFLIEVARSNQ